MYLQKKYNTKADSQECEYGYLTSAYADGELEDCEINNFEKHFSECESCQNFYHNLISAKKCFFENVAISVKNRLFLILLFSIFVILANYFSTTDKYFYLGAAIYALTFLLTDIVAEKHGKKEAKKVFIWATIVSAIPTIQMDRNIAAASLLALIISQSFDIHIFHELKKKYRKLWWARNNGSTIISQFIDTAIYFVFAFPGESLKKFFLYYMIKVGMALLDTIPFYFFAIYPSKKSTIMRNISLSQITSRRKKAKSLPS